MIYSDSKPAQIKGDFLFASVNLGPSRILRILVILFQYVMLFSLIFNENTFLNLSKILSVAGFACFHLTES